MIKKIAKIESTLLGIEDHGIFTSMLDVSYGDSVHRGVGGYSLDTWSEKDKRRVGTQFGLEWVIRTLKAANVDSWEKLKGRTLFVLEEDDSWNARVLGIEGLPTEGGYQFIFDDLVKEMGIK